MDMSAIDNAIAAAATADSISAFVLPAEPAASKEWPDGLPQPGFYYDVDYEAYRSWPAINASALKKLVAVTPKHAKAYVDGVLDNDTKDRRKGRAFHCALLEPKHFVERFPISGPCAEPLASGKRKGDACGTTGAVYDADTDRWYCGTHAKSHPSAVVLPDTITEEQHSDIKAMQIAVIGHKVVTLLRQHGGCEVSIIWDRDGIPCKARLDKLIIDRACPDTTVDLKKIQPEAGTESALQSAIRNYGYDLAAWWYIDGVKRLRPDKKRPLFAWVFVEDAPPYDVHPVWASKAMLEVGRIKAERAFALYQHCAQLNTWPGYCDDIEEINPSDWEMKRYGLSN